ncbi:hypothetical protein CMQ_417 [Grosmannia clavigera kw1407]|uniref:Mitochondrial K+-H+ exchange-related-domain-containing protein n=1 Tax=Grosmannia clavigera (strain kw1407 / UAMH 11150) TaxID=655863 RepID=F0XEZ4_GROCL|nr:uncharacterized protein CMQ_417 [Grosmannia clavigera kw1407]EFX03489.1 hypothetical protein CMQ_417 [Grosmannia clavigera kw1407]
MRLFLLPISTRRTLLFCERVLPPSYPPQATAGDQAQAQDDASKTDQAALTQTQTQLQVQPRGNESLVDKAQDRAARFWAGWEKKPAGSWQRRLVAYGNAGFRRITFEEWGLKSVPPLTRQHRLAVESGDPSLPAPPVVEIVFPPSMLPPGSVPGLLHRLSTERESLHRQRLLWCLVGMPITLPIAVLPVVPNIPFFYLVYRAWSHWRAISGGKHIQFLLQHNKFTLSPSPVLDAVYAKEKAKLAAASATTATAVAPAHTKEGAKEAEALLLSNPEGAMAVSEAVESPQLELELERATWQIEMAIGKAEKQATDDRQSAESGAVGGQSEKVKSKSS